MLVKVFGAAVQGIDALVVTIEVNCSQGIRFFMVGLPDAAVKESHERIVSAVEHNGYRFPRKQVIVNMSPADIRKEGAAYDLPLAVGILASDEKIETGKLSEYMLMGELSLDGSILPIKGALPIAIKAREEGFKGLIIQSQCSRGCGSQSSRCVWRREYHRGDSFPERGDRAGTDGNRYSCGIFQGIYPFRFGFQRCQRSGECQEGFRSSGGRRT